MVAFEIVAPTTRVLQNNQSPSDGFNFIVDWASEAEKSAPIERRPKFSSVRFRTHIRKSLFFGRLHNTTPPLIDEHQPNLWSGHILLRIPISLKVFAGHLSRESSRFQ